MKFLGFLVLLIIIGAIFAGRDVTKPSGSNQSDIPTAVQVENYEICKSKWSEAESESIVSAMGIINSTPTFSIDRRVWNLMDYNTRSGMMDVFVCAVAGPGKSLSRAQVVDTGGLVLGKLDWGTFEVVR